MRILWVGTKVPWPPHDGGRLVAWLSIQALHAAGHRVTLIAPSPVAPGPETLAALRTACAPSIVVAPVIGSVRAWIATRTAPSRPWAAARHAQPAMRARVDELLEREELDVVHAEQPHALSACATALERGWPVVLRAHNVETDLWTAAGRGSGLRARLARREVARVARWEAEAVRRTAATVTLTRDDAEGLRALAGADAAIHHVGAPFPARLEPAPDRLPGDPALVAAGSGGWLPNARGLEWFGRDVWPEVAQALPGARLHVFGGEAPAGAIRHPPPADSREAFPAESIRVVPLLYASGVRMRILEAWARGVPVVATPAAAAGLDATDGRELLLASTPAGFVDAIRRAQASRDALVEGGRGRLRTHHDPATIAAALTRVYELAARASARS